MQITELSFHDYKMYQRDLSTMVSKFIFRVCVILLTINFVLISPGLLADTDQPLQEPLTIVITGSNLPVKETEKTTVIIVDRQDIEQQNPRSVSQLLKILPGLYVENTSSRGSVNAMYLRGAEPNYTAVLINGVKVNDPTNSRGGAFDFSLLDIDAVERVEIVKGPVSSLYGSEAMAGVVNIITSQSIDQSRADIRAEAGSSNYFNTSARAGKLFANGNFSINLLHADEGQQVEGSGYVSDSISVGGDYTSRDNLKVRVNLSYHDSEAQSFPEASGGPEFAVNRGVDNRETRQQHHFVSLQRQINSNNNVKLQFNYFRAKENSDAVGIDPVIPPNINDNDYQRQSLSGIYTSSSIKSLDSSLGVEVEWEKGSSTGSIDPGGINIPTNFDLQRSIVAIFAETRYQMTSRWNIYAGVRVDSPDDLDKEISPRLGLSYALPKTSYRLDWGQGFKLPGFYALAHPIVGNPDFKPETSDSYQLSIVHELASGLELTVAGFVNRYFDLIDFDNVSNMLVQRSEVEIKGLELAVKHQFSQDYMVQFQITALRMDIVASEQELLKRPDRLAALIFNWNIHSDMHFSMSANYSGEIKDFSFPTGLQTLESYTRVDASMDWKLHKHWRIQLALDNLFNEKYQESIGFIAPGAGVRLSVKASL